MRGKNAKILSSSQIRAGVVAPLQPPELHVFRHRHAGEQAAALRHVGDAAARNLGRRPARERLVAQRDAAAGRCTDADQRLEQGRLARTIAAEQRHDFVVVQLETHVAQDVALAVERVHALDAQQHAGLRRAGALDRGQRVRAGADVDRLHLRRIARIGDAAADQHFAVVHHGHGVGERKDAVDVVFDQQHRQVG